MNKICPQGLRLGEEGPYLLDASIIKLYGEPAYACRVCGFGPPRIFCKVYEGSDWYWCDIVTGCLFHRFDRTCLSSRTLKLYGRPSRAGIVGKLRHRHSLLVYEEAVA